MTSEIEKLCQSLVGTQIHTTTNITYPDGTECCIPQNNCNVVGNLMESIVYKTINEHVIRGENMTSPDFLDATSAVEYELKCFKDTANFDISNFDSYISQLVNDYDRKVFRTYYLVFKYESSDNGFVISDFKMCTICEILKYDGKYPISIQNKKGIWYNIRPCSFAEMKAVNKTNELFVESICLAILHTPNPFYLRTKKSVASKLIQHFLEKKKNSLKIASKTGGVAIFPNKSQ